MPRSGWPASSSPPGCASTSPSPSSTPRRSCVAAALVVRRARDRRVAVRPVRGRPRARARSRRPARSRAPPPVAGVVLAALTLVIGIVDLPRSVPLTALAFAVTGMFAARFLIRSRRTHQAVRVDSTKRAVIFGAGSGGRILMQSLVRDPASGIVPVALLDDDHRKARLHFSGVRVRGTRHDLATVAEQRRATTLVIAVPSATSETVRELSALARDCGLDVLVLPPVRELFDGRPTRLRPAQPRRRRPARPPAGRPRHGRHRRPDRRQAGARHRCRRLDRLRAVPPDRQVRPVAAAHARPRRERPARHPAVHRRAGRCSTATTCCCATSATSTRCRRPSSAAAPRSSSTPPRSSTSPCSSAPRRRRSRPTSLGTRNVLEAARARRASRRSSTSPPTRRPTPPACSAGPSASPSGSPPASTATGRGRYISVRFGNVLGSRGSVVPAFLEQIDRAARSPSPTPTSSATSCSSPRPASSCSRPAPSGAAARSWCSTWARR